ncbi:MAG: glycosyltransferase family 2 protein [Acidobacteriota bacterium]|nr:glycosyltransferase family 2 protein [Acidobacteriota bacterium]
MVVAKDPEAEMFVGVAPSLPLVSVIVPTYNYGQFISQTLENLQAQTYQNWECVVVDDDSIDDTRQVVADYARDDPRIKYLHQINQRQAAARNHGLQHATGKYVQFLDADDLIEPYKLERQVMYLEQHSEVDIVYSSVRYFSSENIHERLFSMGKDNSPWMPEASGVGRDVLLPLVRSNIMVINSPLIRRNAVDDVGLFDRRLPPAEDWDFWLRCALAGAHFQFVEIQDTLALVRMHSTSSSQNRIRMYRARLLIRKKLEASLDDEELLALNRELSVADEVTLGIKEASRGSSLQGAWHLARAAQAERRWRWRMKLLVCALASPIVSERRLRSMIASSFTQMVKSLGRKGASA